MTRPVRATPTADFGSVRLIDIEPGACCAGAWANLTITRWQGRGTAAAVERVTRVSSMVRSEYPQGISSIHLICEGAGLPTPEGRAELQKLMNAHADQLACVVVLIGGSGFWASAVRGMVTGLRAVSSRAYQLRLVGTLDEVVKWLPAPHMQRTGVALGPEDLARALTTADGWES